MQLFMQTPVDAPDAELRALLLYMPQGGDNFFAWSIPGIVRELSDDQLEHLARLFTVLEDMMGGWGLGSTTAVPSLVSELERRDRERGLRVADWALGMTRNPYIPFGSHNQIRPKARSARHYRELEVILRHRQAEHYAAQAQREEAARARQAERAVRHAERDAAHLQSNRTRRALISDLERLPPVERMRRVARDDTFHVGAIPGTLADVDAAVVLESADRQRLLGRLQRAPLGPWRAVLSALELAGEATS